jgi:hypothetical protein
LRPVPIEQQSQGGFAAAQRHDRCYDEQRHGEADTAYIIPYPRPKSLNQSGWNALCRLLTRR